jgi:hypothetical protein
MQHLALAWAGRAAQVWASVPCRAWAYRVGWLRGPTLEDMRLLAFTG